MQLAILMLTAAMLVPNPKNPRQFSENEDLQVEIRLLADDLNRRGIIVPLLVKKTGEVWLVVDGNRRLAAAKLAGIETLPCIEVDANATDAQVLELALITSLTKVSLSPWEFYCACIRWRQLNPGATDKDLAEACARAPSTISEVLVLEKCCAEVKQAAAKGLIPQSEWREFARSENQLELLRQKLSGASRSEIRSKARRKQGGEQDSIRVERVKLAVPGRKVDVTIAGSEISLTSAIEAVSDLLREMKKAHEGGLSIKSLVRVLKDKAAGANHG